MFNAIKRQLCFCLLSISLINSSEISAQKVPAQLRNQSGAWTDDFPVSMNGKEPNVQFDVRRHDGCHQSLKSEEILKRFWHSAALFMLDLEYIKLIRPEQVFEKPVDQQLCRAILDANIAVMERLIGLGANVNAKGSELIYPDGIVQSSNVTPLLLASFVYDDPRPFRLLLEKGANPNIVAKRPPRSTKGFSLYGFHNEFSDLSVVHLTAAYDYNRLFKTVFESGGDPNLKADFGGAKNVTPFLLLSTGINAPDAKERLALLISKGAKLDDTDGDGCTLLIRYLRRAPANYIDSACGLAIQLIEAGANPKSFHKVDNRNDYATNGCYLRPIHYLIRISERRDNFLKESSNFKRLIEVLESHGESLKEAESDLKRWKEWRHGGSLPPTAEYPQGLIVPPRPDFKEAIEAEHQQWLKEQAKE